MWCPWQGGLLGGVSLAGGFSMVGGLPSRQGGLPSRQGGLPSRGSPWRGGGLLGGGLLGGSPWQTPPVNRMTDACENITLPQTSFAGGNKHKCADSNT